MLVHTWWRCVGAHVVEVCWYTRGGGVLVHSVFKSTSVCQYKQQVYISIILLFMVTIIGVAFGTKEELNLVD